MVAHTVQIPIQIAESVGCETAVDVEAESLMDLLKNLCSNHPKMEAKIFSTPTSINRYVRIFVNGADCTQDVARTPLKDGAKVRILLAMAGG